MSQCGSGRVDRHLALDLVQRLDRHILKLIGHDVAGGGQFGERVGVIKGFLDYLPTVSRGWRGGRIDEPTFVDVTLWARTAEVANEYLSKGSQILIEGRLKLDSWEKDGQKRSKLRVVADRMLMLGSRDGGGRGGSSSRSDGQSEAQYDESEQFSESVAGPPEKEIPF